MSYGSTLACDGHWAEHRKREVSFIILNESWRPSTSHSRSRMIACYLVADALLSQCFSKWGTESMWNMRLDLLFLRKRVRVQLFQWSAKQPILSQFYQDRQNENLSYCNCNLITHHGHGEEIFLGRLFTWATTSWKSRVWSPTTLSVPCQLLPFFCFLIDHVP